MVIFNYLNFRNYCIYKHYCIHRVRQAGAGGWSWSGVREKHCYLAGGWRLELEWCERELL